MRKLAVSIVLGISIHSLVLLNVVRAETVKLGVVKSLDNEGYWSEIATRLLATGVDYCIVDLARVQEASDLGNTKLLFLPNIERLEPVQVAALQDWMRQGGQVIVSGPVGIVSEPVVRNRLRSLLGAYWGFALTEPSILESFPNNTQDWTPITGGSRPIPGGVVIPASLNSATAAVWDQKENPPAVVTTTQSTFFGWRWGVDGVAPAEVDSAWLRSALSRYNLTPSLGGSSPNSSKSYCGNPTPSVVSQIPPTTNQQLTTNNPQPTTIIVQPLLSKLTLMIG